MRRVLGLVVMGASVLLPTAALADGLEVRLGAFFPTTGAATSATCQQGCNLFGDLNELFGASKDGWAGPTGGVEYARSVTPNVEFAVHADGYGRRRITWYASSEAPSDLEQELELVYAPIGVTVRLLPSGRDAAVVPYVAGGVDLVIWSYRERGDYYNFDTGRSFYDEFEASGTAPGVHAAVGVRLPISYDFSLTSEVRYLWTKKVAMGGDYAAYDIRPGGVSATIGVNLRF